jgi:paraquat-inducible protein B
MTEPSDDVPQALPEPVITQKNPSRLSLVWIVPILAVIIGASLLVRTWLEAGPRIVIEFRTADGLEPGKTEVRYKEVVIGRVESVSLSNDRKRVLVGVRIDRKASSLVVEDTQFWVVRPHIGTAGISGLSTLLSGVYIGVDAGISGIDRREFVGPRRRRPSCCAASPGAASRCARRTWARSTSARRSTTAAPASVGWSGYTLDPKTTSCWCRCSSSRRTSRW